MGKVAKQITAIKKNLKEIRTVLGKDKITKFSEAAVIWKTVKGQTIVYNQLVNAMSNNTKTVGGSSAKIDKINKFNVKLEAFATRYGTELEKKIWS
jgi:hypothetical protein